MKDIYHQIYNAHIKVFEYIAYVKIYDSNYTKWKAKSIKYLFLKYYEDSKAYKLMYIYTKKIICSCNVIFCKDEMIHKYMEIHKSRSGSKYIIMDEFPKFSHFDKKEK